MCVVQSKDREQFGVAYGERFCLLQLVGRPELAKASTRRATPMAAPNGYNMQVSQFIHVNSTHKLYHSLTRCRELTNVREQEHAEPLCLFGVCVNCLRQYCYVKGK